MSVDGGGAVGAVGAAGSVVCAIRSMTIRPEPRSPGASEARNEANLGPEIERDDHWWIGDAQGLKEILTGEAGSVASRTSASNRTSRRLLSG